MCVCANTHSRTNPVVSLLRYITVSGSDFFPPLSANVVVNQDFEVAAAAQSLQH